MRQDVAVLKKKLMDTDYDNVVGVDIPAINKQLQVRFCLTV